MEKAIQLLEECLDIIGMIKSECGEFEDDNLEERVREFLDETEKGSA